MVESRFISYAQNLEDVMLWRALGGVVEGPGFYIDVGAADPTSISVTRAFYDRGWRGLNIEPLPEQAARLREARPRDVTVACAVAEEAGYRTFYRVVKSEQTGLSTLSEVEAERYRQEGLAVEAVEVLVCSLAELCREHVRGAVHFLKVDAEGAEAAVLAGADFAVFRPWIVLVEATEPTREAGSEGSWEAGLLAAGYRFVWFDGLNRFYVAEEHAELARHFRVPANVFDDYIPYDVDLRARLAELEEAVRGREAEIAALRAEMGRLSAPSPALEPAMEPGPVMEVAAVRRGGLGWVYRLVRPVVSPVARRLRVFMTGELIREMADLRARQNEVLARVEAVHAALPPVGPAMERLLLTLAVEDVRFRAMRELPNHETGS